MKYHNKKITEAGQTFDSKRELERWHELLWLERGRKITNLTRQKRFELIPAQKDETGRTVERPVYYIADFAYFDENYDLVVEDAKGFRTKDYIIKRKLMLYLKDIRIKEV